MTRMHVDNDAEAEALQDPEDRIANAAEPEAISLQGQRSKRESERTAEFWQGLLATKDGRAELWKIFNEAGVFRPPFVSTNGFPDANATFFQAGKYAFAQSLFHRCLASDLAATRAMLIEHDPAFAHLAPELKRRGARA